VRERRGVSEADGVVLLRKKINTPISGLQGQGIYSIRLLGQKQNVPLVYFVCSLLGLNAKPITWAPAQKDCIFSIFTKILYLFYTAV
jgi:hypothetical protein